MSFLICFIYSFIFHFHRAELSSCLQGHEQYLWKCPENSFEIHVRYVSLGAEISLLSPYTSTFDKALLEAAGTLIWVVW